jgi:hypothetical protein
MNYYQKQTLAFFIKIQKEHKIMETVEKNTERGIIIAGV